MKLNIEEGETFDLALAKIKRPKYTSMLDEMKRNFVKVKFIKFRGITKRQLFIFLSKRIVGKYVTSFSELLNPINSRIIKLTGKQNQLLKIDYYEPGAKFSVSIIRNDTLFSTKLALKKIMGIEFLIYTVHVLAPNSISYYTMNTATQKLALIADFRQEVKKIKQTIIDNVDKIKTIDNLATHMAINWKEKNSHDPFFVKTEGDKDE